MGEQAAEWEVPDQKIAGSCSSNLRIYRREVMYWLRRLPRAID
jgi:hypothetical protein